MAGKSRPRIGQTLHARREATTREILITRSIDSIEIAPWQLKIEKVSTSGVLHSSKYRYTRLAQSYSERQSKASSTHVGRRRARDHDRDPTIVRSKKISEPLVFILLLFALIIRYEHDHEVIHMF